MLTSSQFPYVDVVITIGTWSLVESVYLDTGFEGGLLIPEYLRHEILASASRVRLKVADETIVRAPGWSGLVRLAESQFDVEIAALGARFLLGRDVLDQITVCFEEGKRVTIQSTAS
jgi:hypothetical protein